MSEPKAPGPEGSGTFARDLLASVVVFLVALPLCMGIAIASGVPPALGLVTGIVGGIVVGALAGSPLQVSGPAAGLAVLVYEVVEKFGLPALGWVVLGAGVLQIASGALGLGRWFRAVSPSVVQGMLAGIGVLIFASQFHVMVDDAPKKSGLDNLMSIPAAVEKGIFPLDGSAHHIAAMLGIGTILAIVGWNKFRPKALKAVPGPLVGVVLMSGIAAVVAPAIRFVDVPESLLAGLNVPSASGLELLRQPAFLMTIVAFALIASAETLLCATAVDRLHDGPRTRYDKELIAQGVGNLLCGAAGALPMTGVIVRSSANVEAGAKTRWSAILHGAWILMFLVAFPSVIELVPTSVLAAVLVFTGYKLVDPAKLYLRYLAGRAEFAIYAATIVAIVATDLLTGVAIGFGLSLVRLLATFLRLEVEVQADARRTDVWLRGAATFMSLPRVAGALESIPAGREVHLHIGGLAYVDHAVMEVVRDFSARHKGEVKIEWDALAERSKAVLLPEPARRDPARVEAAQAAAGG